MVKDIPPPPRLSTRAVLGIGICSDVLVPFLYYVFDDDAFSAYHPLGWKYVGLALALTIFSGVIGTLLGSAMWAKRAETGTVIMTAFGVILLLLIYGNRARFGFDDPKIMVFPFGCLVVVSLLIGRVLGYVAINRRSSFR